MSKNIFETDRMIVTAFVGNKGSPGIQIGLKGNTTYDTLTEEQTRELALALLARVHRVPGYRATDS